VPDRAPVSLIFREATVAATRNGANRHLKALLDEGVGALNELERDARRPERRSIKRPRLLLLLSATEDRYSADAPQVVRAAGGAWAARGAREELEHVRYEGGHALTPERTDKIIRWVTWQANR